MKHLRHCVSLILCLSLLLDIAFPCFAQVNSDSAVRPEQTGNGAVSLSSGEEKEESPNTVIGEDQSRREEYVKVFMTSPTTFVAASYPERVHKKSADGAWVDIDNTLVFKESVWTVADGAFELALPEVSSSADARISENGNGVSWHWDGILSVKGTPVEEETEENPLLLAKLCSSLLYENAFENADLLVTVTTAGVKEDVLLKNAEAAASYRLVLRTEGLVPKQKDERTVVLLRNEEEVIWLAAPELRDAAGAASEELSLQIASFEDGLLTLELSASEEWLHDESRVYPVTLDPYIRTVDDEIVIYDAFVESAHPNSVRGAMGHMYLGKESNYEKCRVLVRFDLPTLSAGDKIVSAAVTLTQLASGVSPSGTTLEIDTYRVTSAWDAGTATWNNMASRYSQDRVYDFCIATSSGSIQRQSYYITDLVSSWYDGTYPNYGVMLKWKEDTGSVYRRTVFFTCNYPGLNSYFPYLTINFLNDVGLENYRSFHSASAGTAGTAYVNDHSGILSFTSVLSSTDGLLMPVSTGLCYNGYLYERLSLNAKKGLTCGYGWTATFAQRIDPLSGAGVDAAETALFQELISAGYHYVFRDADATNHYLYPEDGVFKDEEGLGLELQVASSSTNERYVLKYKDGSKSTFDSAGYLYRQYDSEDHYAQYSYVTSGTRKYLAAVTDGAGRVTTVGRDSSGRLTSVTTPDGRVTSLSYDANGWLSGISYPDGLSASFAYDANGRLTAAENKDHSKLVFGYKSSAHACIRNRVDRVTEYGANGGEGNHIAFIYNSDGTTECDYSLNGDTVRELFCFDSAGRVTSCVDLDDFSSADYSYTSPTVTNGSSNKLTSWTAKGSEVHNLLLDPGFERGDGSWSLGTLNTVSTLSPHTGSQCLLLNGMVIQGAVLPEPSEAYTLSLWLKGEATIVLGDLVSGNHTTLSISHESEWRQYAFSFVLSSSANAAIYIRPDEGSCFIDDVCLEKGLAVNLPQLLENTDFGRAATLTRWTASGFTGTDGLTANDTVKITAETSSVKYFYQDVEVGCPADRAAFVLSAKAQGYTVPKRGSRELSLSLIFYYTDGTTETVTSEFNHDTAGLQYLSMAAKPKSENQSKTVQKVRFRLSFSKTIGCVEFSAPQLFFDETGTAYVYDSDGNLISSAQNARANESYTWSSAGELLNVATEGDELSENYVYTYASDHPHRLCSAKSNQTGLGLGFVYNAQGQVTEEFAGTVGSDGSVDTSSPYLKSEQNYTADGNYVDSMTDTAGNTASKVTDPQSGKLLSATDPEGNTTTYSYDSVNGLLTQVSSGGVSVSYSYENDTLRLATVTHNGFDYVFSYDEFGNVLSVSCGGRTLSTNSYLPGNGSLAQTTLGNGYVTGYTYDEKGRASEVTMGADRYAFIYDARGNLVRVEKNGAEEVSYRYDTGDRLLEYRSGELLVQYGYDSRNRGTSARYVIGSDIQTYTTVFGPDGRTERYTLAGRADLTYTYDELGRTEKREVLSASDAPVASTEYDFLDFAGSERTTSLVESLTNRDVNGNPISAFSYTYDANGNIHSVTDLAGVTTVYAYDSLNRLISSETPTDRWEYTYDAGGNLSSKVRFSKQSGQWVEVQSDQYGYAGTGWKDLLTSFRGETITYDAIGNPLSYYGGRSFTWNGRQLSSCTRNGVTTTYTYNSEGIRTAKNGGATTFYLEGSRIIGMRQGTTLYCFLYDDKGDLYGFTLGQNTYYYLKNLQGDIVHILNQNGQAIVNYTYDDWGNVTSMTGSMGGIIGPWNPFRYRGYFYDSETGLYYLSSRYYDPEVGRFINADSVLAGVGGSLQGYNMFAYCFNNPINMADYFGNWPQWIVDTWEAIKDFFSPSSNSISGDFEEGIIRGSGSLTGGYGERNGRLQVNSKDNKTNGMLGTFGKVSVGNASGKIGIGNDDVSLSLKGVGDGLTASAQAGIQYKKGAGLAAKAKAAVLSGRITAELDLFGWQIEFGVSGDLLSAGAEAMIGVFPDEGFTAKASVGAGLFGFGFVFRVKPNQ